MDFLGEFLKHSYSNSQILHGIESPGLITRYLIIRRYIYPDEICKQSICGCTEESSKKIRKERDVETFHCSAGEMNFVLMGELFVYIHQFMGKDTDKQPGKDVHRFLSAGAFS